MLQLPTFDYPPIADLFHHSGFMRVGESDTRDQPHGKAITDAREPEMRSAFEAERKAVQVTSDEER